MAKYYAALTGPFFGVFYPLPGDSSREARKAINKSRLRSMWTTVHSQEELNTLLEQSKDTESITELRGSSYMIGLVLPDEFADRLQK